MAVVSQWSISSLTELAVTAITGCLAVGLGPSDKRREIGVDLF